MELWPRHLREYRQRTFWKRFYETRPLDEVTEWYGSVADVKPLFQYELETAAEGSTAGDSRSRNASPHTKPSRKVSLLNCGFGAAELAEKLHDTIALRDICTLLSSNESVLYMQKRNAEKRPDLKYVALTKKLTDEFQAGSYDWIIDRGAFDLAVTTCDESEQSEIAARHLDNALHVLKDNGKLLLITLAQDAVLKSFVQHFHSRKMEMRVYPLTLREDRANSKLFEPFCLVVTKRIEGADLSQVTLDYRLADVDDRSRTGRISIYQLFRFVKEERRRAHERAHLTTYHAGNLIFFEVIKAGSEDREPSYSMSVYDRTYPRFASAEKRNKYMRKLRPTIAILVPQADQHHWLYKTPHGHQRLCERAGCQRVICVFLPDFGVLSETAKTPAETVNKIKEDIGNLLVHLAVDKNSPVLLMTQQENFTDERITVLRTESDFAGKVLVFDAVVDEDDEELKDMPEDDSKPADPKPLKPSKYKRRTMIFQCNPRMAQTEIWYQVKNDKTEFEHLHVCHAYHLLMLSALSGLVLRSTPSTDYSAALLGLGGGQLAGMLRAVYRDQLKLTSVEIDPVVAQIAQDHFGFVVDDKSQLAVADAATWITTQKNQGSMDFIIVDINSTQGEIGGGFEGVSCPPSPFLAEKFVQSAHSLLKNDGIMLINCVTHLDKGRDRVVKELKKSFAAIQILKYSEDLNQVLICHKQAVPDVLESIEAASEVPNIDDVRSTLLAMASKGLPSIMSLVNKTPMYLSKHARFSAQLETF